MSKIDKRFFSLILVAVFVNELLANFLLPINIINAATDQYGPKSMKNPQKVTVIATPTIGTPGVYWYQVDDGRFKAEHAGGQLMRETQGVVQVHILKQKKYLIM